MSKAEAPFQTVQEEQTDLRRHYQGVAQETIHGIWRRKWLISSVLITGLLLGIALLMSTPPYYTSSAFIQVNFAPWQEAGKDGPPIAALDATNVVSTAAQIVGSRVIADAVVTRLGLDRKAAYQKRPLAAQIASVVGLPVAPLTPHELAVAALMKQVQVTTDPRSYLISVGVTSNDPADAAKIANAVAVEYLRLHREQQLSDAKSLAERELAKVSLAYGPRHPEVLSARGSLESVKRQTAALRDDLGGQSFAGRGLIAADVIMRPSGPSVPRYLGFAAVVSLAVGIWLVRNTRLGFVRRTFEKVGNIALLSLCVLLFGILSIVRSIKQLNPAAIRQIARM